MEWNTKKHSAVTHAHRTSIEAIGIFISGQNPMLLTHLLIYHDVTEQTVQNRLTEQSILFKLHNFSFSSRKEMVKKTRLLGISYKPN